MPKTVKEYNRSKALFRLEHHPDCEGSTYEEGSNCLIVKAKNGVRIKVGHNVDWLKDDDGIPLDKKLSGAMGELQCLMAAYYTVDTLSELEDMVCELYDVDNLYGVGNPLDLLKEAMIWIGLGREEKIGFRRCKVPLGLKGKCQVQLDHYLNEDDWKFGNKSWIPLKELVKLVEPDSYIDAQWKHSPVQCVNATLYAHYQKNGRLADRYAEELQRRVTILDKTSKFPEVGA